MKRFLLPALAALLIGVATPVSASTFTLNSYDVSLRDADPGLVLWYSDLLGGPSSFDLTNVGDTHTTALFALGTDERALNVDDIKPYGIDVGLSFSQPQPGFEGTASGLTGAAWFFGTFGYVGWDNPLKVAFGNTGVLGVILSNGTFALPGSTDISAEFKLLRSDTPASVPEPASLLLLAIGLFGAAGVGKMRRFA